MALARPSSARHITVSGTSGAPDQPTSNCDTPWDVAEPLTTPTVSSRPARADSTSAVCWERKRGIATTPTR